MRHARGATKLRVMFGDEIAIGPGKAELLESIAATGSISESARQLGMSYRRAWLLVDTMNRCFREPVVASATGGTGGGGAGLTDFGRRVLERYRSMLARADRALERDLAAFSDLLADRPR
jgi:molybdate transport system regulatory protein